MSVTLQQKETTYEVIFSKMEFSVTMIEDAISVGYTQYDVFDKYGDVVEGDLEKDVIAYLESKI